MELNFFQQLIFGVYFSFIIFVFPIVDGMLWVHRFSNKWSKIFLGILYALLTGNIFTFVGLSGTTDELLFVFEFPISFNIFSYVVNTQNIILSFYNNNTGGFY